MLRLSIFTFVSTIAIIVLWGIFIMTELKTLSVNSVISVILMLSFSHSTSDLFWLILGMMSDFQVQPGNFHITWWDFGLYWAFCYWLFLALPQREKWGHCLISQMKGEVSCFPLSFHWQPQGWGFLSLLGRDGSSAPHMIPLTILGSGVGGLTTHYCRPWGKPGFTPLGFLWHHPWGRKGWLLPARGRCKSRLPCGLLGRGGRWRRLNV